MPFRQAASQQRVKGLGALTGSRLSPMKRSMCSASSVVPGSATHLHRSPDASARGGWTMLCTAPPDPT
jgi:hypothetical protein